MMSCVMAHIQVVAGYFGPAVAEAIKTPINLRLEGRCLRLGIRDTWWATVEALSTIG
jgi:hypothetical protein